jgi:probable rRNA maturation factor
MPKREIDLSIRHPLLTCDEGAVLKAARLAIRKLGKAFPKGEVSIAILTDEDLAALHGDFLDDPTSTDVITFPGDPDMDFAGEICVSADRAATACSSHGTTFSHELTLYLMHGLLHLAGYDDTSIEASAHMREGEHLLMNLLQSSNAVPAFEVP